MYSVLYLLYKYVQVQRKPKKIMAAYLIRFTPDTGHLQKMMLLTESIQAFPFVSFNLGIAVQSKS